MALNLESKLVRNSEVLASPVDDELVMIGLKNDCYYGLDDIGRRIWELLDQPRTIAELVNELSGMYKVETARCEGDVLSFLEDLFGEGLVQIAH
jgi:hypothetical protein